jgi:predicted TIM-barrel fold metal-dependent hydrolase
MIIDAHTHMCHISFIEQFSKAVSGWEKQKATQVTMLNMMMANLVDVKKRLQAMDRNNIKMQVVTPIPTVSFKIIPDDLGKQLSMVRLINDGMSKLMEESKGRLIGIGLVPLSGSEDERLKEFERAIHTLGLKGIMIPSNFQGKPMDLPEYESFFALAANLGIPLFLHPNTPLKNTDRSYETLFMLDQALGWPFESMLAITRLIFCGIIERYPALKIVTHHLAGGIPFYMGRIEELYPQAAQARVFGKALSKPLKDYFSQFYFDTAIGGSVQATQCAYDVFGADHMILATDYPFGEGNVETRLVNYPKVIEALHIPEQDKQNILGNNALKLLNIV